MLAAHPPAPPVNSLDPVLLQSPPAVVRHLRADERTLRTATGAAFVAVARDRQLVIRTLAAIRGRPQAVARLAPGERDDIAARNDLEALSAASPPQVGGVSVGPARHASTILSFYREAQRRFGIRWELLAAINFVESDFGRARTTARADAQGPMQFEPATWREYGMGGDVVRRARRGPRRSQPARGERRAHERARRAQALQPLAALLGRGAAPRASHGHRVDRVPRVLRLEALPAAELNTRARTVSSSGFELIRRRHGRLT